MQKLEIIQKKSDILLGVVLLAIILAFSLSFRYQNYLKMTRFDWINVEATVLSQTKRISKRQKPYFTLSLQTDELSFVTTNFSLLKNLVGRRIIVEINTDGLSFLDYLKKPYLKSSFEGVLPEKSLRYTMIEKVHAQHKEPLLQELFGALFFVEPIGQELRTILSSLGVNHLAALSGFHLGLLSMFVLGLLYFPYRYLQQRYFPYRSFKKDSMMITLLILFSYVAFLGFTPSLLRSFTMLIIGFYLYVRGFRLVTLSTLILTVLLLLALFPPLLFSLGFWFSVLGVYMIIVSLYLFKDRSKSVLFIALHISVFLLMTPFALYVFKAVHLAQLFSPLLSMLFILFYPLEIVLHLLGIGDALDRPLIALFTTLPKALSLDLASYYFYAYFAAVFLTLFSKRVYAPLLLFALILTLSSYFSPIL